MNNSCHFCSIDIFLRSRSSSTEAPPDLPVKKSMTKFSRSQAIASSSTDSLDSPYSTSSKHSGDGTFNNRPRSALIAGHLTRMDNYDGVMNRPGIAYARSDRSGTSSGQLFSSHDSIDGPVGNRASIISNSSLSSAGYSSQTRTGSDSGRMFSPQDVPLAQSEDLSPIQPITAKMHASARGRFVSSKYFATCLSMFASLCKVECNITEW